MNDRLVKSLTTLGLLTTLTFFAAACDPAEPTPPRTGEPDPSLEAAAEEAAAEEAAAEEAAAEEAVDPDTAFHTTFYQPFAPLPTVPESLDDLPPGVNVVQFEMRLLTQAMQNILRLIADRRHGEIAGQIQQVHPSKELTHHAIEEGLYAPPFNSDQLEEFEVVDEKFHDDLRLLLEAARNDDPDAIAEAYSTLVQGCVDCHGQFRFP